MPRIKGGYVLTARVIQEKKISKSPPHFREVWNYLYREANHKDNKYGSYSIKRGQLFRSYQDIKEGLSWYVGWRKISYSDDQIKKAMKFLRESLMIDTRKAPGGVLITILNYDFYQDPKNYESTKESTTEGTVVHLLYNKNDKNDKKSIRVGFQKKVPIPKNFALTENMVVYAKEVRYNQCPFKFTEKMIKSAEANGYKYKNWYSAWQNWLIRDIERNPGRQDKKREYV